MAEERKITRRQQAEKTKRHIFNVALELLEDRAFDTIKIRDIVNAAGVSIGTFYNYYKSKLDVYYETYQLADEYFDEVVAKQLTPGAADEKILCFFDHYARYSSELTGLSLTKILYNSNNKSFDRRSAVGMRPLLTEIIRQGVEKGELHSEETVEQMQQFFMIAVRGQVYHWCTHEGSYDLMDAVGRYVTKLLKIYR